jgi:signal transduction histidine kinase
MMTKTRPPQKNFWERWHWIWSALYYLSLIVPLTMVWMDGDLVGVERPWAVGLVLLSCGWHWFWTAQLPKLLTDIDEWSLRERPLLMFIYLVGAILIWSQILAFHPLFNIHLAGFFSQFFLFLPILWAIVATTLLTMTQIVLNAYFAGEAIAWQSGTVWGPLLGIIGASILGFWISGISEESGRRQELVEELRRTQANLAESERSAGTLAERQRLAHEIHDTLAQGFIGIIMHLEAAQSLPAEQAQQHVQQAEQMARENLQQARYLVEDLHPKRLQEASLPDAIMTTVQQWREQSKVVAHVTVTGEERPLPANTEHTLLRATQEALANIRKHAQANEVTITLSYMDDLVMLDVQDDGVGLNGTTSAWQGGFGLTAMRERIEQLGGSLLVESEDGEGTTVVVSIPVDSDQ